MFFVTISKLPEELRHKNLVRVLQPVDTVYKDSRQGEVEDLPSGPELESFHSQWIPRVPTIKWLCRSSLRNENGSEVWTIGTRGEWPKVDTDE